MTLESREVRRCGQGRDTSCWHLDVPPNSSAAGGPFDPPVRILTRRDTGSQIPALSNRLRELPRRRPELEIRRRAGAAGRRLLATGGSRDPPHVARSRAGGGVAGAGGAGQGKFASRVQSPGAPAAAAQVPSAWVGMELPTVNLKVATGRAGRGRGGSCRVCWAFGFFLEGF